jgi:PilZ domain
MPFRPRPRRLDMPGVRVQFGHAVADLVDLSRTGVSIRTNSTSRPGSEWPLVLEISAPPVRLTGRVVRCVPADVSLPGGAALRGQYALSITFVNPSDEAQAVLEEVCGTEVETGEGTR